jgi:hypothetical protein
MLFVIGKIDRYSPALSAVVQTISDKDLTVLGSYEGIPILNADQFLERLSSD